MKRLIPFCLFTLSIIFCFAQPAAPLTADASRAAASRWLQKPVLASVPLDSMENLQHWEVYSIGADPIWDARVVAKPRDADNVASISISKLRRLEGSNSLLLRTPVQLPGAGPKNGRGWGRSGIRRHFDSLDWTGYNRISFWLYPDLPGFYTTALDLRLYNNGKDKLPGLFGQEGETSLILRNHEWNHVVWEISNVSRDRITALEISYGLSGHYPGEADSISFYFDKLDLEKVEPDKIEGWDVWPGRISYSHDGYMTGSEKTAITSTGTDSVFRIIDQASGQPVLSKPVKPVVSAIGRFRVMDFSEIRQPGEYVIENSGIRSKPFRIEDRNWDSSLVKALNFLYAERCGFEVPGVHGICHGDWTSEHDGKKIIINGGWHDAGDLTQGVSNTGEIAYGLFSLAERMAARGENPVLYARVMEEATWGLDWLLKTSFGDGYRNTGSISSRRTDGIIGNDDDVLSTARNNPMDNFVAATVEAIGSRVIGTRDSRRSAMALKMAEADWAFGVEGLDSFKRHAGIWTGTFDSDSIEYEIPAQGILGATELYKATGNRKYADQAIAWAGLILRSQQRRRTEWDTPLTGFFYATTAKDRILHFVHRGRDQVHILALIALCNVLPDHPDWMKWYSSVALYSEYLKTVSRYTAPYSVLPASVYSDTEYLHVPESRRESFRRQVLTGIPLGKGHFLRLFPVWMDYRGHFGAILPQAQALAAGGILRSDVASPALAIHQMEWIIGRNPFSQSTMYGEGNDFVPLYTPSSGDIVGSLPVGIQTRGDKDAPYWPVQNTWTYKEIWTHPVASWIWLLRDVDGPAQVSGYADASVECTDTSGRVLSVVRPDMNGKFSVMMPPGIYRFRSNGSETVKTLLPTASCEIDLRATQAFDFAINAKNPGARQVRLLVTVRGSGSHTLSFRTDNLLVKEPVKQFVLGVGEIRTIEVKADIMDPAAPWMAVVYPDGKLGNRREITGGLTGE